MLIRPNANDWYSALRVHRRFAVLPGSEHIASRFSLAYLAAIVRQHDCPLVLEFGAGIGTLTYLLLQKGLRVVALEHDPFCLDQLKRNIPAEWKSRLTLITDRVSIEGVFDLVIIDGNLPRQDEYRFLRPGTICFVEGCRQHTSWKFQQRIAAAGLYCELSHYEPWTTLRIKSRKTGLRSRFKVARLKTFRAGIVSETPRLIGSASTGAPRPKARRVSRSTPPR